MKEKAYTGIDIFRIAAAVMVIAIHTYPLASYGESADYLFTHVLCRLAVPFFFTASGFFLFRMGTYDGKTVARFLKKTAVLYFFAIVLYIPVNIYTGYFKTKPLLPSLIRDLLFDGTFYHLWYLPAALLGAGLAWLLIKRIGMKGAIATALVLYVVGLFGDSYYGLAEKLPIAEGLYSNLFLVSGYTRNRNFFRARLFYPWKRAASDRLYASRKTRPSGTLRISPAFAWRRAFAAEIRTAAPRQHVFHARPLHLFLILLFKTDQRKTLQNVRGNFAVRIYPPSAWDFTRADARKIYGYGTISDL